MSDLLPTAIEATNSFCSFCLRPSTLLRVVGHERHDGAPFDHGGELERIPVGHSDATMRFRFADIAGIGGTMDPVAFARQVDPDQAYRIIRSRLDGKTSVRFDAFKAIRGIVRVRWVS